MATNVIENGARANVLSSNTLPRWASAAYRGQRGGVRLIFALAGWNTPVRDPGGAAVPGRLDDPERGRPGRTPRLERLLGDAGVGRVLPRPRAARVDHLDGREQRRPGVDDFRLSRLGHDGHHRRPGPGGRGGQAGVLGGIQHALVGSLLITLVATLISVPIGLLTSIWLVEYSRGSWLARLITFLVDVMTGIRRSWRPVRGRRPDDVLQPHRRRLLGGKQVMGFTAAIALSVLMIPWSSAPPRRCCRSCPTSCARRPMPSASGSGGRSCGS